MIPRSSSQSSAGQCLRRGEPFRQSLSRSWAAGRSSRFGGCDLLDVLHLDNLNPLTRNTGKSQSPHSDGSSKVTGVWGFSVRALGLEFWHLALPKGKRSRLALGLNFRPVKFSVLSSKPLDDRSKACMKKNLTTQTATEDIKGLSNYKQTALATISPPPPAPPRQPPTQVLVARSNQLRIRCRECRV